MYLTGAYKKSKGVNELFKKLLAQPDLKVKEVTQYWTTLHCSLGRVVFWNENKYYGWASEGKFYPFGFDEGMSWYKEMPGRIVMWKLKTFIENHRFDTPASPMRFNVKAREG